ncbi:shikimate kinase [Glaciihabitans tibetensis]|uniref:Shikimate kinase n=1 Tax=Glaciihabitans tibetensis TaxID=1266600 RepID=A0A2T0VJH9_9MICO|nr:shikimate kinase [Glaciihabitans tibetensis]PRY70368.1 shikimate kinase [Glaciihabitans tibetensis]
MPDRPLLVLIGAPAAGKTRLGKRVANLLGVPFVDTDKRIVAAHGAISDIFAEHGEPHFRELEREAVEQALTEEAVVALGGGAVLHADTQRDLVDQRVVLLTVTRAAVEARITTGKRPLVAGVDSWQALVDARRPLYESLATRTFDTSHRHLDDIAADVARWIQENDS